MGAGGPALNSKEKVHMDEYLAETVIVAFTVGGIFGAIAALHLKHKSAPGTPRP